MTRPRGLIICAEQDTRRVTWRSQVGKLAGILETPSSNHQTGSRPARLYVVEPGRENTVLGVSLR